MYEGCPICFVRLLTFLNAMRRKLNDIFWGIILLSIFVIYFITSKNRFQNTPSDPQHALCILVPVRDALEELMEFVPYMSEFLNRQGIRYYITVIHQNDDYRFNKGVLFNAGFQLSTKDHPDCDYIALHDVDLLPLTDEISYAYPGNWVFHVTAPEFHPMYHVKSFLGGILLMQNSVYIKVDGLTNVNWGWGSEDFELRSRILEKHIEIKRPRKLSTDKYTTFRHIHGRHRKRDLQQCKNQLRKQNYIRRDRITGLRNVQYEVTSYHYMTTENFSYDLYNVNVPCNKTLTPWCLC